MSTKKINDGGPAFPIQPLPPAGTGERDGWVMAPGMSLRDWFAGQAIASLVLKAPLLDRDGEHGPKFDDETLRVFHRDMAISAYQYADAMIAVRAKVQP